MTSTKKRSFVKGVVWELTGPLVLFAFAQQWVVVFGYTTVRIVMYFIFERAWKHIRRGKETKMTTDDSNGKKIWMMIFEKGRLAQWLGIVMCTTVALCGGFAGFLAAAEIVKIVFAGVGLAGGVELIRKMGNNND